jgi:hypothetical protein
MNIDDLTIGQARELARLFQPSESTKSAIHPAFGRYCVVRCYSAGVHVGVVVGVNGGEVALKETRRIWSWQGALSCTEIAVAGITGGKLSVAAPENFVEGRIEIIPCSKEAESCLRNFK